MGGGLDFNLDQCHLAGLGLVEPDPPSVPVQLGRPLDRFRRISLDPFLKLKIGEPVKLSQWVKKNKTSSPRFVPDQHPNFKNRSVPDKKTGELCVSDDFPATSPAPFDPRPGLRSKKNPESKSCPVIKRIGLELQIMVPAKDRFVIQATEALKKITRQSKN